MADISDASKCRVVHLPDSFSGNQIARLIYTNSGGALLALASNAVHKLWKWQKGDRNPKGLATASTPPALWQPPSGIVMTNDLPEGGEGVGGVPAIALSKNDSYVMSASGGKISLFNMLTFKVMTTFMPPPPAATFLAFHPQDNNIIAIGMEDASIQIYNVRLDEVKSKLRGHSRRVTGLAFSNALNVLVSSGADAQLCVWSTDGWEKRKSRSLFSSRSSSLSPPSGDTYVQFHNDQQRLLAVHEGQMAIFEASKLDRIRQWSPRDALSAPLSSASFSCDSSHIFAAFADGAVAVFDTETLRPLCRLSPSVYSAAGPGAPGVHPLAVASHPSLPSQFALGLSDGSVVVLEPLQTEGGGAGRWSSSASSPSGAASSLPSSFSASALASAVAAAAASGGSGAPAVRAGTATENGSGGVAAVNESSPSRPTASAPLDGTGGLGAAPRSPSSGGGGGDGGGGGGSPTPTGTPVKEPQGSNN